MHCRSAVAATIDCRDCTQVLPHIRDQAAEAAKPT